MGVGGPQGAPPGGGGPQGQSIPPEIQQMLIQQQMADAIRQQPPAQPQMPVGGGNVPPLGGQAGPAYG